MSRNTKQPDPKRAAAIRAGLARRRALGGKLGRAFQYTPEQAAQVVRLREQGLSWSGVASEMSIPISTARTLYVRGVQDMSKSSAADMLEGGAGPAAGRLGLSQTAAVSLGAVALEEGSGGGDADSALDSGSGGAVDCVIDLSASGEALLSMLIAHEPRLGLTENQERTRRLLAMMLDLPPSDDAEAALPECPDPRQRVWALAEINAVRKLLSDGMAQLKIAKTVNASPNDISAIKQDRIDRVRGGYIVHRTKAKMQRYRARLTR